MWFNFILNKNETIRKTGNGWNLKIEGFEKKSKPSLRHLTSHHRSVHVKNLKYVKNMY